MHLHKRKTNVREIILFISVKQIDPIKSYSQLKIIRIFINLDVHFLKRINKNNFMKFPLFLFILLSAWNMDARSFHFPDVEYAYAKIYYFNLGEIKTRPDDYIYSKEDGFAKSISGEGKISSKALTSNIEKLFLYHKDGLLNGLSGCYIPRHGIIYFDENDTPVASLSICFECEAIRMWTIKKGKIKSSNPKATEGESQLNTLKNFILKEDIMVSKDLEAYDKLINQPVMITMTLERLDTSITQATYDEVKAWCTAEIKEGVDTKYTGGGEKYEFGTIQLSSNTKFIFYDKTVNAKLGEAYIDNSFVVLPNGIHVGSSLEDVMNTLLVYDGPSNPSVIILEDEFNKIVYTFENQKLVLITINK